MFSQKDSSKWQNWAIKPVYGRGYVMVHRLSIGHLVKGFPSNYEINVCKKTIGNRAWQVENNRPEIGLTLQCLDFANPTQLGYALTLAPFVEIPFREKEKSGRMVMRVCWGATYITKPFDILSNHKNIAIGSHVNSFVQFRWFWQFKLSNRLQFEPGFSFTHASNGRAKNPNLGLNVMSVNGGLRYQLSTASTPYTGDVLQETKSRYQVHLACAYGFNRRGINTDMLKSFMLSTSVVRNIKNAHSFSAGLDVLYDQSYQIDIREHLGRDAEGMETVRIAARLGYAYNIGRVSLPIEIGAYAYQKINPDAILVSRLGVRYFDKSGLIVSFGLRTHYAVAYTFEYGLGYCFGVKK